MRRWSRAALCGLSLFFVLPATRVAAHSSLVESTPVDGSVVAKSPTAVVLRFTESVMIEASTVRLVHLGSPGEQTLTLTAVGGPTTLLANLPKLARGAYILRYIAVDPADLHKTVGSISFGVGVAAPPSESGAQVDGSWLSSGLRAVTDSAVMLAVGAVVVCALLVLNGSQVLGAASRLIIVSTSVAAAGWVALLGADAASVGVGHIRWGSLLLHIDPGRRAFVGVQLAIGMWCAVRLLVRSDGDSVRRFVIGVLGVIAAGVVFVASYGGHAGIGGSFLVGVLLRVVHIGSLCLWIGAVAAMYVVSRGNRSAAILWPKVSALAAIGVAATGASGLLLSGRVASTVTALLGTTYGNRIVMKAGLLVVLAVLGAVAARRIARGAAPRGISVELGVSAVAIVIAALLAGSAPARGPQFSPEPTSKPQVVTSDLRDLTVSASLQPARPGANLVQVRVLETRKPSPGPVHDVTFRLVAGDGSVVAERRGVPQLGLVEWADVSVSNPGLYRVEVDVGRPSSTVPAFVGSWDVDPVPAPRVARVVSTRPWAPIAAVVAVGWVALVIAGRWRVRRIHSLRSMAESAGDPSIGRSTQLSR